MNHWRSSVLRAFAGCLCFGLFCQATAQEGAPPAASELRTWKSADGGFSTEATFVERKGTDVVLQRKDGNVVAVPLARLSPADRDYVFAFVEKAAKLQLAQALEEKPLAQTPKAKDPAHFDAVTVIKAWDQPYESFRLTLLASWKLEAKPDYFELSANGELLYAASYGDAKHRLFSAKDGQLLHSIEYGTVPLTAAAISPDGRYIAATLGETGTGIYDVSAKKEVFVHANVKNINLARIAGVEKPVLIATQPVGVIFRYPVLGGKGIESPRPRDVPEELPAGAKTEFAVSADGSRLIVSYPYEKGSFMLADFDDAGGIADYHMPVRAAKNGPMAIGKKAFGHAILPDRVTWARMEEGATNLPMQHYLLTGDVPPQISVSPDDAFSSLYEPESGHLLIHHVSSRESKRYQFLRELKPVYLRIHWGKELVATCDRDGAVSVTALSGYRTQGVKVYADLRNWLENKQDDRLEAVALELEKDRRGFANGTFTQSKAALLHHLLSNGYRLKYHNGIDPFYRDWLKRNPESRLARFCGAERLRAEAWQARGSGFADMVTEEGFRTFHAKLAEAETIIDTFAKEPTIPPLFYPLIMDVAKGLQWDEEKVTPYVDRLFKECPDNLEAHASRAEALMPRWGGEIEDCRKYAERVADHLGGPAGDVAYAAIAQRLHNYHSEGVFKELGFDVARVHRGIKHHFRDNLDSPHYRQATLLFGILSRDSALARRAKVDIIEHNDAWVPGIMQESFFDRIMLLLKVDK